MRKIHSFTGTGEGGIPLAGDHLTPDAVRPAVLKIKRKEQRQTVNISSASSREQSPEAIAAWLNPVPWQIFGTLLFPWSARAETVAKRYASMINTLECKLRAPICHIHSVESRSKTGMVVPRHIHCAMAAYRIIDPDAVADLWENAVHREHTDEGDDIAKVTAYNPARDGIGYVVKQVQYEHSSWDVEKVNLFVPDSAADSKLNHRSIRFARRHLRSQAT
jgi:hypothetical protein